MKKLAILILMTTVISMTYSCQNKNVAELKAKQAAAIDQEVSNRLDPIREDLLRACDTRVDSMILAQAEEIAAAEEGQKTIAPPKPKSSGSGKTSTPPPTPAPKTTTNTNTDKKKSKIKGAIEKVIKPSDTKKKKDKMKGEKVPVSTESTNKKKSKMKGKKKD